MKSWSKSPAVGSAIRILAIITMAFVPNMSFRWRSGMRSAAMSSTPARLRIGKVELGDQHRRQGGERGAVQVVDGGGEHEYREYRPAVARGAVDLRAGPVHWKSMVATSPAVASRALAFGKYATVTLRAFCTPQPSDTSPEPAYTTFAGSATSSLTIV